MDDAWKTIAEVAEHGHQLVALGEALIAGAAQAAATITALEQSEHADS